MSLLKASSDLPPGPTGREWLTRPQAQRFRLDLVPGFPAEPAASVTLRPAEGVRVTLRPVD